MKKLILTIIVLTVFVKTQGQSRLTLDESKASAIRNLMYEKYIDFNFGERKAFVSMALWNSMDFSTKENFARNIAIYIANVNRDDIYNCEFRDKQSGKLIAKMRNGKLDVDV